MTRFIFLFFGIFSIGLAHASFPPSTIKNYNVWAGEDTQHYSSTTCPAIVPGTKTYSEAIAQSEAVGLNYSSDSYAFLNWTVAWTEYLCPPDSKRYGREFLATKAGYVDRYRLVYVTANCASDETYSSATKSCDKASSCPVGSTLSGGACVCNSGYIESGSTCIPSVSCPTSGGVEGYISATSFSDALTQASETTCVIAQSGSLCGVTVPTVSFAYDVDLPSVGKKTVKDSVPTSLYNAQWMYTGSACVTASAQPSTTLPEPTCASGQFLATVNGVTKCYDSAGELVSSADDLKATETTSSNAVTNPDGSTTVTTTKTNDLTGATSTSTQIYASGVTPPVSAVSTTSDEGDDEGGNDMTEFCAQNPSAAACKTINAHSEFCEENPNNASCVEYGEISSDPEMTTQPAGISALSPISLPGVASCPADVPLPHGTSFSYAPLCMYAEGLKPVILAMAWLLAGLIVVGAKEV